jgi:hypothetical protein
MRINNCIVMFIFLFFLYSCNQQQNDKDNIDNIATSSIGSSFTINDEILYSISNNEDKNINTVVYAYINSNLVSTGSIANGKMTIDIPEAKEEYLVSVIYIEDNRMDYTLPGKKVGILELKYTFENVNYKLIKGTYDSTNKVFSNSTLFLFSDKENVGTGVATITDYSGSIPKKIICIEKDHFLPGWNNIQFEKIVTSTNSNIEIKEYLTTETILSTNKWLYVSDI